LAATVKPVSDAGEHLQHALEDGEEVRGDRAPDDPELLAPDQLTRSCATSAPAHLQAGRWRRMERKRAMNRRRRATAPRSRRMMKRSVKRQMAGSMQETEERDGGEGVHGTVLMDARRCSSF